MSPSFTLFTLIHNLSAHTPSTLTYLHTQPIYTNLSTHTPYTNLSTHTHIVVDINFDCFVPMDAEGMCREGLRCVLIHIYRVKYIYNVLYTGTLYMYIYMVIFGVQGGAKVSIDTYI